MKEMNTCLAEEPAVLVTCRSRLNLIRTIRERISNTPREALFRKTCFGWFLDLDDWPENCVIIHFMLGRQVECLGGETDIVPLSYYIVDDFQIQFGREEFCLVIGLRFGVEYSVDYNNKDDPIPFRQRVFSSSIDGKPIIGKMLESKIKSKKFYRLNDHDVVSLYCVAILQFVLLGLEDRRKEEDVDHKAYSLFGFTWAFKPFRVGEHDYYKRERRYPRVVAWRAKKKFFRNMLRGFFHGRLPTRRLTPNEFEAGSDWWVSSRAFFDGHISEASRIPRHVNRQNEDDFPSDFYCEFEKQKRVLKEMMKNESARE
ncbi:hypothetical protein Tco_1275022 [Tanacetum coccineum]